MLVFCHSSHLYVKFIFKNCSPQTRTSAFYPADCHSWCDLACSDCFCFYSSLGYRFASGRCSYARNFGSTGSKLYKRGAHRAASANDGWLVPPQYTLPDTSIAREQLERLRATLAYITSVRSDPYASQDQKMNDLAALQDIQISQETATAILDLSESRWQAVQQEAIIVLERVMRNTIRENEVEAASPQRAQFSGFGAA